MTQAASSWHSDFGLMPCNTPVGRCNEPVKHAPSGLIA